MIDRSQVCNFFNQVINSGKVAYDTIQASPIVAAAQPAIGAVGVVLGAISGYELGRTAMLKARGLWRPSIARPVVLLTISLGMAALASPYLAAAIGAVIVAAAIFGVCRGALEKQAKGPVTFKQLQEIFGSKPANVKMISPRRFANSKNPTKKQASGLIWHLTRTACRQGQSFTEGTFVLEGDDAKKLYDKLSGIEGAYERHSSHFKGRVQKNTPQMGLDFSSKDGTLPVGKRTILFGLADTNDGKQVLFIKPENWGADKRIFKSPQKFKHFVNHTTQFLHAQYVKIMRPGYDDRPGTAKERIPHKWSGTDKFGWSSLSKAQKQTLIAQGLAKKAWKNDTYRTGREVYIKIDQSQNPKSKPILIT